jgi:YozE SAM-like fold
VDTASTPRFRRSEGEDTSSTPVHPRPQHRAAMVDKVDTRPPTYPQVKRGGHNVHPTTPPLVGPDGRSLRRAHNGDQPIARREDPMTPTASVPKPITFRRWLQGHRRAPTRFGDVAREIAQDREFPREPLTADRIAEFCELVNASGSFTEAVLDAFAQYQQDATEETP